MRDLRRRPTVYLAGPTVFEPDPDALFMRMKEICAQHGVEGVSPLDNQMGLESIAPGAALAHRVVEADIQLMRRVDGGVFCLDGFRRGPEMDAGTAFEVGFMSALGKPVAGWTRDLREYPERVRAYFHDVFGLDLTRDAASGGAGARSGALRDPDGILVHSEGCLQNAMIHVGIKRDGGEVCADENWEIAFDAAIGNLAARLVVATTKRRKTA